MVVSRIQLPLIGLLTAAGLVVLAAAVLRIYQSQPSAAAPMTTSLPADQMESATLPILDLKSLTRQADLVVVGRVAGDGTTRVMVEPAHTPIPFNPATTQPSANPGKPPSQPQPQSLPPRVFEGQPATTGLQTPITAYPVQIERVLRGSMSAGQQVTVSQIGGTLTTPDGPGGAPRLRPLQVEDDRLMHAGERYVLFLSGPSDGSFDVLGGVQGRLSIDAAGKVHPVGGGSPATRTYDGQSLDAFLAAVTAAQ